MKLVKGKWYELEWIDAVSNVEWNDEKDLDKLIEKHEQGCVNRFYFVKESSTFYAFSSGYARADKDYFDIHLIPKKWIQSVKQLR
jgi:hypothetical protein